MLALGLVAFVYAFQQTAVIPAIATIEHALHTGPAWAAWLLSGYLMVATVVTPALGRLGDLHGHARVLLRSLGVFLVGSIGAATLPGLPALIICRAAQGVGGAVLPLAFAISRRHLPDEQVSRAIAGLTGAFGLGAAVGFATGGLMTQLVSWRLVFGSGAATVLLGLLLLWRLVPRPGGSGDGRFDAPGALWLGATSLGVLLALTVGQESGWLAPAPILLLLGASAAGVLWVRTELRHEHPLVDLRVLRDRTVTLVNGATVGLGWSRFVGLLLLPELVQGPGHGRYGFGAGALAAGLFLLPDGVGLTIGGPLAGRLASRMSPGRVLTGGLAVIAGGAVAVAAGHGQPAVVAAGAALLGLGGGIATQASSAVTTRDVPAEAAAASSSLNSTIRRFAGGVGGQVSVVALAAVAPSGATASATGFVIMFVVAAALALGGAGLAVAI